MIQPFVDNSEPTQKERREILESDRKARKQQTYFGRAEVDDGLGGRYANPAPHYPKQPPSSPWASDPVPSEPPLGIDINYVEPVGTLAEQAEAAARVGGTSDVAPMSTSRVETADVPPTPSPRARAVTDRNRIRRRV